MGGRIITRSRRIPRLLLGRCAALARGTSGCGRCCRVRRVCCRDSDDCGDRLQGGESNQRGEGAEFSWREDAGDAGSWGGGGGGEGRRAGGGALSGYAVGE